MPSESVEVGWNVIEVLSVETVTGMFDKVVKSVAPATKPPCFEVLMSVIGELFESTAEISVSVILTFDGQE